MAAKLDNIKDLHFSKDSTDSLKSEMNHKLLKPLDEALRCRICFEYFNNCMITKCSHNYCSVCIRRYMTFKAQCPVCFQDASEPELRNNRLIDEVLRTYMKIKEILIDAVLPQSKSQSINSVHVKIDRELSNSNDSSDKSQETEEESIDDNEVPCPVCYKVVLKDRINIHLDSCLRRTEQYSERKTLPKLVYHLLSDKEIRKKLKEHGLTSSGERQTLIRRHKNFLTLYNSNQDSLNPKPVVELVLEIEKQEIEERINSFTKPIQVHKRSEISEINREHELYAKQHQSQFNALIQDLHQRHIKQIKIKQEVQDESTKPEKEIANFPEGDDVSGAETFSLCDIQKPCQSNKTCVTTQLTIGGSNSDVDNIKKDPPPIRIVETRTLSKGDGKIEDWPTSDNLSTSLDDYETEHT